MANFRYKGITDENKTVSGTISAYDEFEAVSKLRETLKIVSKIKPIKDGASEKAFRGAKIKEKELALICSQFSIIISSGLPLVRCVEMVAEQQRNKTIRELLMRVAEDIGAGYSMAQSFENRHAALPKTFIESIRAGETSGTLEASFKRLYKYYDKSSKMKGKLTSALMYPAIVVVVAIVVFIIIMVVAVPLFKETFEGLGTELPGITKALIGISDFLTHSWWLLLIIIAMLIGAFLLFRRTESGKKFFADFAIKYSPLKRLKMMNLSADFANSMSTMIAAGLPIINSVEITANVITNYSFALALEEVRTDIEQGRTLKESMAAQGNIFSKMLVEMTGVGESAGSMEETLDVIGDYYTNESQLATEKLLSLLEPVMTVGLALMTVVLLLAVYLPMFSMYGSI